MFNINKSLVYDPGQVHYMVDTDYRTLAQGWTRTDGTGPLDLWNARNTGYVFFTPGALGGVGGGARDTDALAIQAGIDAMIDFRGDTLFFTPGAYAPTAVLAVDVADARWLGPKVSNPKICRATITSGVAAQFGVTSAAARMEVGYLRFVPLTAQTSWVMATGVNNFHMHDIFYNSDGIAADAATVFMDTVIADYYTFENIYMVTDAAQGAFVESSGAVVGWLFKNIEHTHNAGTLACSLWLTTGTGTGPVVVDGFRGSTAVAGVVTTLITLVEGGSDLAWVHLRDVVNNIGYCAATALVTLGTAEAGETDFSNCYLGLVGGFTPGTGNDGRGTGTPYTQ